MLLPPEDTCCVRGGWSLADFSEQVNPSEGSNSQSRASVLLLGRIMTRSSVEPTRNSVKCSRSPACIRSSSMHVPFAESRSLQPNSVLGHNCHAVQSGRLVIVDFDVRSAASLPYGGSWVTHSAFCAQRRSSDDEKGDRLGDGTVARRWRNAAPIGQPYCASHTACSLAKSVSLYARTSMDG